jgi:hypothetical protein
MSAKEPYPLTLEPIPAEQFQDRSGRPWPVGEMPEFSLGTLWLATDTSRVAAGPQAGRSLGYLRHLWGADMVGLNAGGDLDAPLPVELKLKNTGETVQTLALTEYSLWYILDAMEDALIRAGFRPETTQAEIGAGPGRWAEFMPEFEVEAGRFLWLPPGAPLLLGPGLTLAQCGPPSRPVPAGPPPGALTGPCSPVWLAPLTAGPEEALFFKDQRLSVRLVTTARRSDLTAPEALTFLWPLDGQGRVLCRGPAPTTRLQPGRAILLPAALGRYAVESAGTVSYLLIESR